MKRLAYIAIIILALLPIAAGIIGHSIGPGILHPANLNPQRQAETNQMLARTGAHKTDFTVRAQRRHRTPRLENRTAIAKQRLGPPLPRRLRQSHRRPRPRRIPPTPQLQRSDDGFPRARRKRRRNGHLRLERTPRHGRHHRRTLQIRKCPPPVRFGRLHGRGHRVAIRLGRTAHRSSTAEDPFASLREVSYDYAGLDLSPLLGKTLFRPATIFALDAIKQSGGFDPDQISPEIAVTQRQFPILLICGTNDHRIPCRHAQSIYNAAIGPKEMWIVPGAGHAMALGQAPAEYETRVITFFEKYPTR